MLAVGFDSAREAQYVRLVEVDTVDAGDRVFAFCEGAGLVEQDGVDGAHTFERQPVLDEDARACADRG
jgi:hypothetical protein